VQTDSRSYDASTSLVCSGARCTRGILSTLPHILLQSMTPALQPQIRLHVNVALRVSPLVPSLQSKLNLLGIEGQG